MKTIVKILVAFIGGLLLITAVLSLFVHYYLTDERVKKLVVPKLENVLAREVQLQDIQVSLWKGVTLNDFVILEADGQEEFVKVEGFNLSYDLLPLLNKKLRISRIVLNEPRIRVVRNVDGRFNFESLKPLDSSATGRDVEMETQDRQTGAMLPLALSISEVKIKNAHLTLEDQLEELPAIRASADGSMSFESGRDLATIEYSGRVDIEAEAIYEVLETRLNGGTSFDRNQADFHFDLQVDDQKMTFTGLVKDYMESPDLQCDMESISLDLDYLLAALGSLGGQGKGETEAQGGGSENKGGEPVGMGIPEGLRARGEVRVAEATYRNQGINDFELEYVLRDRILHLKDISAETADGRIGGRAAVDLGQLEPDYNATLVIRGVQLASLQKNVFSGIGERVSGTLIADLDLSGAGFQWPALAENLNGEGTYKLLDGRIHRIEIVAAIAALLREERLEDIYYEEMSGNLRLDKGDVILKTSLDAEQVDISAEGVIGLDGNLALPMELELSRELSRDLTDRTFLSRYLIEEDGSASLKLYLTGSFANPRVSLDTSGAREAVKKKLTETIRGKVVGEVEKLSGPDERVEKGAEKEASPEEVVNEFIEGILGK